MSTLWFRIWRSVYRKEPITGFILIVGAVNVAIGGIDQSAALVYFGLGTVGVALAFRLWQSLQRPQSPMVMEAPERVPVRALPPQSSNPSLPDLSVKPPRR